MQNLRGVKEEIWHSLIQKRSMRYHGTLLSQSTAKEINHERTYFKRHISDLQSIPHSEMVADKTAHGA